MNIKKKHKLYLRDAKGAIRRLDKLSISIYGFIINQFYEGGAEKRYSAMNKGVKLFSKYLPIQMIIPRTFQNDFKILKQAVSKDKKLNVIEITINGRRLCDLQLAKIETKPE